MFCPNCGFDVESGEFCPNCGAKMPAENQSEPKFAFDDFNAGEVETKSKKGGKKLILIIVAALLVVAIMLGFVFGLGSIGSSNNPFSKQSKKVKRNSDAYNTLMVLSALDNTIFNSKSLTASASAYGDEMGNIKLVFGKDIASSEAFLEFDGEDIACLYDGTFLFNDYGDGYQADAKEVMKSLPDFISNITDKANEGLDQNIERAKEYDYDEEIDSFTALKSLMEDVSGNSEKTISSIIKGNHINRDSVNTIVSYGIDLARIRFSGEYNADNKKNLDDIEGLIASFVANSITDEEIKIEKKKSDGKTEYDFEVNMKALLEALADYLDENPDIIEEYIGEVEGIDELIDELKYEAEYMDEDDVLEGTATVDGKYLTKIVLDFDGDKITFKASDINKTKVTEKEYKKVEKNCDDIEEIDVDDINDIIEEF